MKICVVGVGRWGRNHVRVLSELLDKGLVDELVVCDKNAAAARRAAEAFKADAFYDDPAEMVSKEHPDGIIVAVPTLYHYRVATQLLPHADLLVEKPIAATLEEAKSLILEASTHGRIIMVGHIERFNQGLASLKEEVEDMVKSGDEIVYINAQRVGPGPARGRSLNLGVAHDLMVHDLDAIYYLLGCLTNRVVAVAKRVPWFEHEVEVDALYTFDNGAETVASLRASYVSSPTFKKRKIIVQTLSANITFDYILQSYTVERGVTEHRLSTSFMEVISAYSAEDVKTRRLLFKRENEPLLLEDKHFIDVLRGRADPLVTGVDGYIALKNAVKALESSAKGRAVEIIWDEPFVEPETR